MKHISVAIDGPSGAGKSTLARQAAAQMGYLYVDTGAIYRTVALGALRRGVEPSDAVAVEPVLSEMEIRLAYNPDDGLQHMYLDGEDVSEQIRLHEISQHASKISAIPKVREFLLELQRDLARNNDVVMDGRDIGTVVLPDAQVKIFLTASAEARAKRRFLELQQRGQQAKFDTVLRDIIIRDEQDSNRPIAPLRQAEDAVLIDTTDLSLEQSLQAILAVIREGKRV
ncbi:MAG: (d)CMP kinase [Oscillospiraceae bacterium]|nr:(d)CMP kinase [Oscillospiraceae bacterium]